MGENPLWERVSGQAAGGKNTSNKAEAACDQKRNENRPKYESGGAKTSRIGAFFPAKCNGQHSPTDRERSRSGEHCDAPDREDRQSEQGTRGLDGQRAASNRGSAAAAMAAQREVGENWKIIVPGDRGPARETERAQRSEEARANRRGVPGFGLPGGNGGEPVDQLIEETAPNPAAQPNCRPSDSRRPIWNHSRDRPLKRGPWLWRNCPTRPFPLAP